MSIENTTSLDITSSEIVVPISAVVQKGNNILLNKDCSSFWSTGIGRQTMNTHSIIAAEGEPKCSSHQTTKGKKEKPSLIDVNDIKCLIQPPRKSFVRNDPRRQTATTETAIINHDRFDIR